MRCKAVFAVVLSTFLMSVVVPIAEAGPKASAKVTTKSAQKTSPKTTTKSKTPSKAPTKKVAAKSKAKPKKQTIPDLTPEGLPNVLSGSVVVLDVETGEELFGKNPNTKRPIASVSKLAAAIAVRGVGIDLTGVTAISARDAEIAERGSKPHVNVGWKVSNKDLLYASLIASENRAVPAMGRSAGLTEAELIKEMNAVAKRLKLKNTSFDETTGLSYNNKSTARDVAKLLRAAMEDPILVDAMQSETYDLHIIDPEDTVVPLWNTNRLIHSDSYKVLGAKTGYNNEAGYCLVVGLEVNKRKVIVAVLGAEQKGTRYGDVARVVTWLKKKK
jgi:serine-type D-Ala-D-Ala endopeptidase (penicillin-binding protein 7)